MFHQTVLATTKVEVMPLNVQSRRRNHIKHNDALSIKCANKSIKYNNVLEGGVISRNPFDLSLKALWVLHLKPKIYYICRDEKVIRATMENA